MLHKGRLSHPARRLYHLRSSLALLQVVDPVGNTFPAAAEVRTDTAVDRSIRLVGGTDPVDKVEEDRQDQHHGTVVHTRGPGIVVTGLVLAERDSTEIRTDSTIREKTYNFIGGSHVQDASGQRLG
jgi:hypothetical protein